jgi:polysaccharide export outer membrane protein
MYTHQSLLGLVFLCLTFLSSAVLAQVQSPTPEQIEQFKRLPPAQQKALARSMGIDIDDIQDLIDGGTQSDSLIPQDEISGNRRPSNTDENDDPYNVAGELRELDEETEEEELKPFGYDLFELGADAFLPATDIPIPSDYIMGPGDTLIIQLYGKESSNHSLTLSREGEIQFPEIGPISLAGLSFKQAQAKIGEVVSEQMIGIKSSVTMGKLRTIRVFVLGDVNVPGSYVVGSLSTMTNALFASGGVSEIGTLRNIQLKRNGEIITTLDVYDLLLSGDTSGDARLLPGDVIFVPPIGPTAGASGGVKRPAIYELKGKTHATALISLAGGLSAEAYPKAAKIERVTAEGERTFVDLDLLGPSGKSSIQAGDIIHIATSLESTEGTVFIDGHVKRPDERAWSPGLRFTQLVSSADKFLALPDLAIAIIEREDPNTRQTSVLSFSPREAFSAPGTPADPLIQARDKLRLFGFEEDRAELVAELVEKLELQASINQRHRVVRVDGSVCG